MDGKFDSTSGVVSSSLESNDGDRFCRLCFSDEEAVGCPMRRLWPEDGRPDRDLLWKILECTTLKLTFDDDNPAKICGRCIERMDDFCDYRMQCLRNDKRINSRRAAMASKRSIAETASSASSSPPKKQPHLENSSSVAEATAIKQCQDDPLESFSAEYVDEFEDDDDHPIVKQEFTMADEDRALLEFSLDHATEDQGEDEESEKDHQSETGAVKEKKKRTRKVLIYEDHSYFLLSSRPRCDSITWGCFYRKTLSCPATIGTKADGQILGHILRAHNHPPKQMDKLKRKAVTIHAYRLVEEVYLEEPYEIVRSRMGGDVLLYGGDRYPYSHSRRDGCRIWKCGSHRGCAVSIYLAPDGKIFKMSDSLHTMEPKRQKFKDYAESTVTSSGSKPSLSDVSASIEEAFPNPVGTFNYKIVKNSNNRNVLIYEGDRYCFYYKKTNGWTVWRCTISKACQAMLYQLLDESVAVLGETVHNHFKVSKDMGKNGEDSR